MAWKDQEATNPVLSYERAEKQPSPLLIIGLGGVGCDMLRKIKRTFAERFCLPTDDEGHTIPVPERTAYLAIDTDRYAYKEFETGECLNIAVPNVDRILKDQEHLLKPEERTWMHAGLTSVGPGVGTGPHRSVARLMLSRNFDGVRDAIQSALRRIATFAANHPVQLGEVEIVILTSMGGGTGSGIFLDIPQIVRHIMETDATLSGQLYRITGYLVMPDVMLERVGFSAANARICANAYAALKELDFWMGYHTHRTHYTMTYGDGTRISWVQPYDDCVLLSCVNVMGRAVSNPFETVETLVAEELLHSFVDQGNETDGGGWCRRVSVTHTRDYLLCKLPRPMPLHYCYCAMGSYTLNVPQKKLIFYEGSLLFETFMPPRDKRDNLVPNEDLLLDGKTFQRVGDMTGNIGNLYNQFAADNPYPAVYKYLDPRNKDQMNSLRKMQPVPHKHYSQPPQWNKTVLEPAARKAAEGYLKLTWDQFRQFCSLVLADPKKGPFSLLLYLTDEGETAFMPALRKVERQWEDYANNLRNDVGPRYDACVSAFDAFLRPPLLGRIKAEQNYLDNLKALLNAERLNCFMREYYSAMRLFVQRVEAYVETSLRPLCKALEAISSELTAGDKTADDLHGDLYSMNRLKGTIDATFTTQNQNNKVSRDFLERLCRESLETVETLDGCGVSFPFAQDIRRHILVIMRDELNAHLGDVNGQSLDGLMVQAGNKDDSAQIAYIGELSVRALNNASPLFYQNNELAGTRCVEYNFLAVPKNAPKHMERLRLARSTDDVDIHESALRDHIYCAKVWDGLPLYRYGLMDKIEENYEAALGSESGAGIHLVWDGKDSPYTSNWTKLPDPKPYYLFHPKGGSARARKEYEDAHQIVDRALKAGLLTMDASREKPDYTFRIFYTDQTHRMPVHESAIMSKVNALVSGGDSEDGDKLSGEALRQALKELMAQAAEEKLELQMKPEFMAGILGLQDQPINPFDPQVESNQQMLALARANYEALCREFAVVLLLQRPELYDRVCVQLPGFEAIVAALEAIDR